LFIFLLFDILSIEDIIKLAAKKTLALTNKYLENIKNQKGGKLVENQFQIFKVLSFF
jgi:hypothetical protein